MSLFVDYLLGLLLFGSLHRMSRLRSSSPEDVLQCSAAGKPVHSGSPMPCRWALGRYNDTAAEPNRDAAVMECLVKEPTSQGATKSSCGRDTHDQDAAARSINDMVAQHIDIPVLARRTTC